MELREIGKPKEVYVDEKCCLYSYVITRDYGFAPNPFGGICTLATCKPGIRNHAKVGDWVIGIAGASLSCVGKIIFLMKVNKIISLQEYWACEEFNFKKPGFNSALKYCYGDNIYHLDKNGQWVQENSHHSLSNGVVNPLNRDRDTKADRVLISENFWYFGSDAKELPKKFNYIRKKRQGYKKIISTECQEFISWAYETFGPQGQHGLPVNWGSKNLFSRYDGK